MSKLIISFVVLLFINGGQAPSHPDVPWTMQIPAGTGHSAVLEYEHGDVVVEVLTIDFDAGAKQVLRVEESGKLLVEVNADGSVDGGSISERAEGAVEFWKAIAAAAPTVCQVPSGYPRRVE